MKLTTLCYIENDKGQYLMLHRTKKEIDISRDKWLGIGGHFEEGESPGECLLREVKEETGLTLTEYAYRGIITFCLDDRETEYVHLFTATGYEGQLIECDEGDLVWVDKNKLESLNLWEGDFLFLKRLQTSQKFISMKLCYDGDKLIQAVDDL